MQIEEKVKQIISEQLGINIGLVTCDADIKDKLGADSLDLVEICMTFEEQFGIIIEDDEADRINTVEDAVRLCQKKDKGRLDPDPSCHD